MKVLLYFESIDKIKKSGIGRAMRHQMQALESAGVDFTIDPNDSYDMVHINTLWGKSKRLLKKCNKNGIPAIVHGHSTYEDFRNSFRLWKVMKLWFYPQLTYMYGHAGMIITPTPYSEKLIRGYHLCDDVVNVSNGIELKDYAPNKDNVKAFKEHFNITNQKVVIGIGFPFERKGLHDFIEVARLNPSVTFIWFGYLQRILTSLKMLKAMKNKPDNVILPGYIDNSIIKGAMQYAACLFFPSYEETEGIVVLEALASHCPVLVRRIGVYDPWLKENESCLMASNNEEFNEKLQILLTRNNTEMVQNGYKVVEERTLEKVGKKLKTIYNDFYTKNMKK